MCGLASAVVRALCQCWVGNCHLDDGSVGKAKCCASPSLHGCCRLAWKAGSSTTCEVQYESKDSLPSSILQVRIWILRSMEAGACSFPASLGEKERCKKHSEWIRARAREKAGC